MVGSTGVTLMDVRVFGETVRTAVPVTDPDLAVIVVWPEETELALPFELTVATDVLDELQSTNVVRSCVVLSE
jgi:hypothetical protein